MSLKQINDVIQSEKCISHIKNLIDYHLVIKSEKEDVYTVSRQINTSSSWKIEGTESEFQKCHIKICKYLSGIAKDCYESKNFNLFEENSESISVTL